jgi:pilus assembly protein Flp/PilA
MKRLFVRLLKDQSGVTAMEYGLIAGLVAVVIIGAVTTVGIQLNAAFTTIGSDLAAVAAG